MSYNLSSIVPGQLSPVGSALKEIAHMDAFKLLREAIKAVPAVKYALGVAGIAAVVAIVLGLKLSPQVAVFGTLIVLGLMFILVLFSQYSGAQVPAGQTAAAFSPVSVLVWFYTIALVVTTSLFISSYFVHVPRFPFGTATPDGSQQRFSHTFTFNQKPFSISMPSNQQWNHGVSALDRTDQFSGKRLQVDKLTVTMEVDNKGDLVCCDVWVYVGSSPFGFPTQGGSLNNNNFPPYEEPPAAAGAPTFVKFVIGNGGASYHSGDDTFWAEYDFQTNASQGYPHLDNLKQHVSQPFVVNNSLYAQVLVWNGNPTVALDVRPIKLEIEGTIH
jgi:hypothetical protein